MSEVSIPYPDVIDRTGEEQVRAVLREHHTVDDPTVAGTTQLYREVKCHIVPIIKYHIQANRTPILVSLFKSIRLDLGVSWLLPVSKISADEESFVVGGNRDGGDGA